MPPPTMFYGLPAIRRDNPWPESPATPFDPFYLALDGGGNAGREIVLDAIREHRVELMIEVGCFLCGSTRTWLEASAELIVIGVDPWDGNWSPYLHQMIANPARRASIASLGDKAEAVADILYTHGNYRSALNNIREFKDRFVPVRRTAPQAFEYLKRYKIQPQMIYIDADKHRDSLDAAYRCFPDAILCGDDWLWPDETGALRMQENVKAFAADHGFEIRHQRQTWLLIPSRAGARPAPPPAAPAVAATPATPAAAGASPSRPMAAIDDPAAAIGELQGIVIAQAEFIADLVANRLKASAVQQPQFAARMTHLRAAMAARPEFQAGDAASAERLAQAVRHLEELEARIGGKLND